MVKDSRNPGACGVLLPPWSVDGPERFLLFQICALTVFFLQKKRFTSSVANENKNDTIVKNVSLIVKNVSHSMIQLLHNVFHAIRYNVI